MYRNQEDLFADEELLEEVENRMRFTPSSGSSGGLHDQVESHVNRAKNSAFKSSPSRGRQETPELAIVAGVLALRLALWYLFRTASKRGLEISAL